MFYLTTFPVSVFIYQAIKKLCLVFWKQKKIQITTIKCYKDYNSIQAGYIKVQGVRIFLNFTKKKV